MRAAVCDDDHRAVGELVSLLNEYSQERDTDVDIVTYSSGAELNDNSLDADILFLDYAMPGDDGLETAKRIRSVYPYLCIVFVTSHSGIVYDSFEVQPFRFLLKPVDKTRLFAAIDDYVSHSDWNCTIEIPGENGRIFIRSEDIAMLEAKGRCCSITTNSGSYTSSDTISEIMDVLPRCFYRLHRSYAVNMFYIEALKNDSVMLTNGVSVPLGRLRSAAFRKTYKDFVKNRIVRM